MALMKINLQVLQVFPTEMYKVYYNVSNVVPNIWMIYLGKKKKYYITLGTFVILFQEILNLYIMDEK